MLQTSRIFCRCSEWKIWQIHFCTSCDLCISFFCGALVSCHPSGETSQQGFLQNKSRLELSFLFILWLLEAWAKWVWFEAQEEHLQKKYNKQDWKTKHVPARPLHKCWTSSVLEGFVSPSKIPLENSLCFVDCDLGLFAFMKLNHHPPITLVSK